MVAGRFPPPAYMPQNGWLRRTVPAQSRPRVVKIIDANDLETIFNQVNDGVATDITGTAGYENFFHLGWVFSMVVMVVRE